MKFEDESSSSFTDSSDGKLKHKSDSESSSEECAESDSSWSASSGDEDLSMMSDVSMTELREGLSRLRDEDVPLKRMLHTIPEEDEPITEVTEITEESTRCIIQKSGLFFIDTRHFHKRAVTSTVFLFGSFWIDIELCFLVC